MGQRALGGGERTGVHRKLGSRRRNRDELQVVAGRAAALTEGIRVPSTHRCRCGMVIPIQDRR